MLSKAWCACAYSNRVLTIKRMARGIARWLGGVKHCWNYGWLELWTAGTMDCRSDGLPERWIAWAMDCLSDELPERWIAGLLDFCSNANLLSTQLCGMHAAKKNNTRRYLPSTHNTYIMIRTIPRTFIFWHNNSAPMPHSFILGILDILRSTCNVKHHDASNKSFNWRLSRNAYSILVVIS
jgi:hypothetical protein